MSSTLLPVLSTPRHRSPSSSSSPLPAPSPSPLVRPELDVLASLHPLLSSPHFNPNHQNTAGDTLLMTAARSSHSAVVALLLASSPTLLLDLTNHAGWSALRLAARQGDVGVVVQLVGAGADVVGLREALEGRRGRGGRGRGGGKGLGESRRSVSEAKGWMVRDEDRWRLREGMEEGLRVYEQRLRAKLSEAGVTGDAFLPPELQRLIIDYLTAAPP